MTKAWNQEINSEIDSEEDGDSYDEDEEVSAEEPEIEESDEDMSDNEIHLVVAALQDAIVGSLAGADHIVGSEILVTQGTGMNGADQVLMAVELGFEDEEEYYYDNDNDSLIAHGGYQAHYEHAIEDEEYEESLFNNANMNSANEEYDENY